MNVIVAVNPIRIYLIKQEHAGKKVIHAANKVVPVAVGVQAVAG